MDIDTVQAPPGWRRLEQTGFAEHVGPLWFLKAEEGLRFGFRVQPHHANPNGVVHGGMMMFLADHVMGAHVWHAIGRRPCATISLNCDFLGPARPGDWVEGRSEITRKGRAVVFCRGTLEVAGEPVLTADGVWKVIGER